jgi:hypothetical protein
MLSYSGKINSLAQKMKVSAPMQTNFKNDVQTTAIRLIIQKIEH